MKNRTYDQAALTGLYNSSTTGRAILQLLSAMPRQDETEIIPFGNALRKKHGEIQHRDIVKTFKQLADYGVGEFIEGRRGHPSRFRWEVDSLHIMQKGPATEQVASPPGIPSILADYHYPLRPSLTVLLQLPTDISQAEAQRLCQFISSLPFDATGAV